MHKKENFLGSWIKRALGVWNIVQWIWLYWRTAKPFSSSYLTFLKVTSMKVYNAFNLIKHSFQIRGGTKSWILKPQVNFNVTPIYKNWGKRIFEFGVRLNPPHWPSNFENHHYRVKNQSCCKLYIWVSKPIRRKIQNQWKKLELNRAYQLREESKKPPENTFFF